MRFCMLNVLAAAAALSLVAGANAADAADPASCQKVRMAEPGWNDLAFTTGVASTLLKGLGYQPSSNVLAIEVIYKSLANKDLDVFLGYWDPAMVTYYAPYKKDASVETVHQNLQGAKYTFAVPQYVYDAGVHDIADLQKFADKFDKKAFTSVSDEMASLHMKIERNRTNTMVSIAEKLTGAERRSMAKCMEKDFHHGDMHHGEEREGSMNSHNEYGNLNK